MIVKKNGAMSSILNVSRFVMFAALAGMLLSRIAFAQTQDGNLVGSVLDTTGAAVPNAKVEVENTATGVKTTTMTDTSGFYRFNNLLVGTYKITASATGLSAASREVVSTFQWLPRFSTEAAVSRIRYLSMPATMRAARSPSTVNGCVPGSGSAAEEEVRQKTSRRERRRMVVVPRVARKGAKYAKKRQEESKTVDEASDAVLDQVNIEVYQQAEALFA